MKLIEFQGHHFGPGMATNWLNPASSSVTGYYLSGHSYHPGPLALGFGPLVI